MTPLLYLLIVSFLVAVLTLGYGLLLRRSGWFAINRAMLWLIVALAGWLPLADLPEFGPNYLRGVMQQTGALLPGGLSHRVPGILARPVLPTRLFLRPPTPQPVNANRLFWVYGIGVLMLTMRLGQQVITLRQLIRTSSWRHVDGIRLIESIHAQTPFSFFQYVVLNPALYTSDELNQILRHERLHYQYWHSVDRLASAALQIVLWVNPLMWWHGRLVQENLEYQVDRAVLKAGVNARDYQFTLLTVSLLTRPIGLTNSFSRLPLVRRIRMMNRRQSVGAGLLVMGLFGLIIGSVLLAWPTAQRALVDRSLCRFAVARGNQTYFIIVPTANASDLREIQDIARQRNITFEIAPTVLRDGQHRIQQISFGVRPTLPAHSVWTSLKAGAPYGHQLISPLGIRCDPMACTLTSVDRTFPFGLRELAQRESVSRPMSKSIIHSRTNQGNLQYGLYETYFLDDMIESSFFGLRAMLIRIRPDKRLDLYDEARDAVIIWDRHEISRTALQQIRVTEVMKLSVYKGDAAVARLGDERARPGLVVLSKHPHPALAEEYAASRHLYR